MFHSTTHSLLNTLHAETHPFTPSERGKNRRYKTMRSSDRVIIRRAVLQFAISSGSRGS